MTAGLIFGPKEGFGIYNRHIKGKCLKKNLYRMIQGNLARVSDVACGSLVYLLLYITVNIFYNILYSYQIFFIYPKLINFLKTFLNQLHSYEKRKSLPYLCHLILVLVTSVVKIKVQFHWQMYLSALKKKVTPFASLPSAVHSNRLSTCFSLQERINIGYVVLTPYHNWAMFLVKIQINSKTELQCITLKFPKIKIMIYCE